MGRPQDFEVPASSASASIGKNPQERTSLQAKASEAGETLRDVGHTAVEAAREGMHRVREVAREKYDAGVHKAQELSASLEDRIRQHPMRSVLIAFGAGLLVSGLVGLSALGNRRR